MKNSFLLLFSFFCIIHYTPLKAQYCTTSYSNTTDEWIENVSFNTINNTTTQEGAGSYGDYTSLTTTLTQGNTYTLSVTFNSSYSQYMTAWIDWNGDNDFTDTGEEYPLCSGTSSPSTHSVNVFVPGTSILGSTRMRITTAEFSAPTPCGNDTYGEAEDYSLHIIAGVPMSFVSSTVQQPTTTSVFANAANQEIIKIVVVTSGYSNPLNVTEFKIRTDGSSNYSNDISDVSIWYTGANSNFTTTNQFGLTNSTPSAPGNDMVFSGNQGLLNDTNYFWVSYSISNTAIIGNVVDALCRNILIGGTTRTPSVQNPVGSRPIMAGCLYTLSLFDGYGDGWNGASLNVNVNGVPVLLNVDVPNPPGDTAVYNFMASTGDNITTVFNSGSFDTECSYKITNPNGAYVLSDGTNGVPSGATAVADCSSFPAYTTNGNTFQTGTDCFVLTEASSNQSGSVWYNYQVDLNNDVLIGFNIYLGTNDGGADGMAFVFQGDCTASGGDGGTMGYGGITPSVEVEFDTYQNIVAPQNFSDISTDHIAILSNGDPDHASVNSLSAPVSLGNIEDGVWHSVSVSWTTATTTLSVIVDGSSVISYTGDIVTNIFGGTSNVFWGFTAGTGTFNNLQEVCVTNYPAVSFQLTDTAICSGDSILLDVGAGANSYTWTPNNGTINNSSIHNPVFSPTTTTLYTVLIEDACGNTIQDNVLITVQNCSLPIELLYFDAQKKDNKKVQLHWATSSEINNDYFTIMRSKDSYTWENIEMIDGAGNSNYIINYEEWDKNPFSGISFYKLKQTDYDGHESFSDIVSVYFEGEDKYTAFYNYQQNGIYVSIPNTNVESQIQLIDDIGRLVYSTRVKGSRTHIISEKLTQGIYILLIYTKEGIQYKKKIFSK